MKTLVLPCILSCLLAATLARPGTAAAAAPEWVLAQSDAPWEQISPKLSFTAFCEREEYSALDRVGRFVFAVETGGAAKLEDLAVEWSLTKDGKPLGGDRHGIVAGLLDVTLDLPKLGPGRYDVAGRLVKGKDVLAEQKSSFRCIEKPSPPQEGRIAVVLPGGVAADGFPVQFGVPFPKGALWSERHVRLVRADGTPVPSGAIVRSRWGATERSSIRWLGIDFQPEAAGPWWPERKEVRYYLEFGSKIAAAAKSALRVDECPEGFRIDTGPLQFLVRRQGFNLLDDVRLGGKPVLTSSPRQGLYLVDHEGATYRAANDPGTTLVVEERSALRAVLRAEGWYVKDGTSGERQGYSLPTDKLCRFIARIEAYAGKPYVRVINTWIVTYDTFSVRLKDLGLSLPLEAAATAAFGVEEAAPVVQPVPKGGVRLVQHLPDAFAVEDGSGKQLAGGRHSAGWVLARSAAGLVGVSHRDTWQRFPKELEALPDALRLHVWPVHGRDHPEIDETASNQIHRLWFAHQGHELNLTAPWKYYLASAERYDTDDAGVYEAPGHAMGAVHATAMGAAVTSDILIHFENAAGEEAARKVAACFQQAPHALADPAWTCGSLAMGWVHPYDPERFAGAEDIIATGMRAYWAAQNDGQIYGMWLYRPWHHSTYHGKGVWDLYRLYNGTHHYEAIMPWLFYARSGDPFYLTQGSANLRELTDVQTIHYDDPRYPQKEFHGGQKRLVGSTRHDDCLVPWGGDHGILGHLTCCNGIMLAYYLTGDLRAREVVVDEWQRTLVADRGNPQYAGADRSNTVFHQNPRDNGNAVGEILDLYQLTHDPRLLALLAPRFDIWLNQGCMRPDWGYPLHNVLAFHGSEKARRVLLDGAREFLDTNGKPGNESGLWSLHAPHEVFALAGILKPEAPYAVQAFCAMDLSYRRDWAWRLADGQSLMLNTFPDCAIYLPHCMYSLAQAADAEVAGVIGDFQAMPRINGVPMRCIVREDRDQDFTVRLVGQVVTPEGIAVRVLGPDNAPVAGARVAPGWQSPFTLRVPKDGRTGQYVVFVGANQNDHLLVPVTALPEVYAVSSWTGDNTGQRFFVRSRGEAPETIRVQTHRGPGTILSADRRTTLASTETGEVIAAEVGPQGAWIWNETCYMGEASNAVLTLAVSPARWFAPDPEKLKMSPPPP